jgi:hypothetical protein
MVMLIEHSGHVHIEEKISFQKMRRTAQQMEVTGLSRLLPLDFVGHSMAD